MMKRYVKLQIGAYIARFANAIASVLDACDIQLVYDKLLHESTAPVKESFPYARLSAGWPIVAPAELPKHVPEFFSITEGSQRWPAILLTKNVLEGTIEAVKQREELAKTEGVVNAAMDESMDQEDVLYELSHSLQTQVNKLEKDLGDRASDSGSWSMEDGRNRNRLGELRKELAECEMLRLHLERERAIWRNGLLKQHQNVLSTQKEADNGVVQYLKDHNLLPFNSEEFLAMWRRLPARYRNERYLQKRFNEFKAVFDRRNCDPPYSMDRAWSFYRRNAESRLMAFCGYEDAKIELDIAEKEYRRFKKDIHVMEDGYRMGCIAGKDVPSPSEFARDCITEEMKAAHACAEARARLYRATQQVERWDHISELNSDAMMNSEHSSLHSYSHSSSSATSSTSSGSSKSTNSVLAETGRKHPLLGAPQVGRIHTWRSNVESSDDGGSFVEAIGFKILSEHEPEYVDMDNSKTVYEQRQYQRVRGRQWHNRQYARDERLLANSRTIFIKIPEKDAVAETSKVVSRYRRDGMAQDLGRKRQRRLEELHGPSEGSSALESRPSKRTRRTVGIDRASFLSVS